MRTIYKEYNQHKRFKSTLVHMHRELCMALNKHHPAYNKVTYKINKYSINCDFFFFTSNS